MSGLFKKDLSRDLVLDIFSVLLYRAEYPCRILCPYLIDIKSVIIQCMSGIGKAAEIPFKVRSTLALCNLRNILNIRTSHEFGLKIRNLRYCQHFYRTAELLQIRDVLIEQISLRDIRIEYQGSQQYPS